MLTSQAEYVEIEPVALAINLAKSPRNAKMMCEGAGLKLLLKRKPRRRVLAAVAASCPPLSVVWRCVAGGLSARDPVLLKLVRTLCEHSDTKVTAGTPTSSVMPAQRPCTPLERVWGVDTLPAGAAFGLH
jgi:hypothetical protein